MRLGGQFNCWNVLVKLEHLSIMYSSEFLYKLWEVLLQANMSSMSFMSPLSSLQGLWMLLFSWWLDDEDTPCHAYKFTCPLPLMFKPFDSTWSSSLLYCFIFSMYALIFMPSLSFLFIAFKVVWLSKKTLYLSIASGVCFSISVFSYTQDLACLGGSQPPLTLVWNWDFGSAMMGFKIALFLSYFSVEVVGLVVSVLLHFSRERSMQLGH